MLHAFREWRRERVIGRDSFDRTMWRAALARWPFLADLSDEECDRLRRWAILFLDRKSLQGAGGLVLDAEMRLAIALQACLPILNLDIDYYDGWVEVIVYPDAFVPQIDYTDVAGVVHSERQVRAGEAWLGGPVVLSWADVARAADGGPGYGMNVVIHEFAHKLDMLDGGANGCPPLHRDMSRQLWARAFEDAYADFRRRMEEGADSEIDSYAAESPGEFFAVLSEVFFENPRVAHEEYPGVYEQLRLFYRQDPLLRRRVH